MKLRQIFENIYEDSGVEDVAIMFGRFNPPHFGHVDAWRVASDFPEWFIGTNQSTQGPKDPLPHNIKIEAMTTLYPEIKGHLVAEQTWFTLAAMVYKKFGPVTLHVVTDPVDVKIYLPMLQKQNGVEGPHGFYRFKDIVWARAERQSEASLVRKAVKENNPQDFEKYSGVPADTMVAGHPYFDVVRHYMLPYMQAEEEKLKKQQEKEAAKAAKKTVKKEPEQPEVAEGLFGLSAKEKGAIMNVASKISDIPGNWDFEKDAFSEQGIENLKDVLKNEKYVKYALNLTSKDYDADLGEEAAGVGIITKQNTTADVNASTPGKNLRAFKLAEEIEKLEQELREAKTAEGHLSKRQQRATRGVHKFADAERWNADYVQYRTMIAAGMSDGTNVPDLDAKSWIGKFKAAFPYTEEEVEKLKKAYKAAGASYKDLNNGDLRSQELETTNVISPVAKPKKNKYGV